MESGATTAEIETLGARALVAHFVPQDGVGGVEVAARAAATQLSGALRLHFLSRQVGQPATHISYSGHNSWHPYALIVAAREARVCGARILVFSLWKSAPIFILLRLLRPGCRFVVFLHATRAIHLADWLLTKLMVAMSDAVWADSRGTLAGHGIRNKPTRVISYLARSIQPRPKTRPAPRFIFWGRLAKQKNLGAALEILAEVARNVDRVRFDIIGRNDGDLESIRQSIKTLGLSDIVRVHGELSFSAITELAEDARFYLQTSTFEGMAASVVEAMQLGLVPVVTPVGEIANYCQDGRNSIVVHDAQRAVARIRQILASPEEYERLSAAAANTWKSSPSYHDDFLSATKELYDERP